MCDSLGFDPIVVVLISSATSAAGFLRLWDKFGVDFGDDSDSHSLVCHF